MVIKMDKDNKKNNLLLYIIIAGLIIAGIFLVYKLAFSNKEESKLVNISVAEIENKISNKETFILVISQTGCSHCEQYLPELDKTLKEVNKEAYLLNITGLSNENTSTLNKYVNFSGTPTTIFFHEGEEKTTLNRIVGYASKTKIIERLQSLGYID